MYCANENLWTYGSVVKVADYGPDGTRFEPNRRLFFSRRCKKRTVNNALIKIIGINSGLFPKYVSTAVLQQRFRNSYFCQKSGYLRSIFKNPIFWPNPLDSTSILGHFLRVRKKCPKIGQKIGFLKSECKYPLFVDKNKNFENAAVKQQWKCNLEISLNFYQ